MKSVPAVQSSNQPAVVATGDSGALMKIIERAATDPQFDVAKLEQLLAVKERWEATEARKAFVAALGAFKANPPELTKNKHVSFETSKGTTEYHHATLDQVSLVIGQALSQHGLSHRWETEQVDGGLIRVTCVLTHTLGHSERVTMQAGRDESGGKNSIQGLGSTVTYLQRYTLLAATGMAVKGQDDDGKGPKGGMDEGAIADHIAAMEAATTVEELQAVYVKAYRAAQAEKDQGAMRSITRAKDARKASLNKKGG